ncbi:MAG TPA: alpha/beta hydrolase [Thermoanaerobaculia bacterium]|nr:alpha/beta hydrolase [Thermoanaerobaculia bacterium]
MDRVRRFREEHPLKRAAIGGQEWEYIAAGRGERALLLLPGALAVADSTWLTLPHFEERFRVIAPTYAPVLTMAELADGIAGILDREGIQKAAVSGGSYGGLVAQVFVRRHPERTERLILSHTSLPDADRARPMQWALRLLRWMPEGLIRSIFRKRLLGLLPRAPETAEFRAYTEEVTRRATKREILALFWRGADFLVHYHLRPGDLAGWPGRVLLLMSDDDPVTPEPARKALQALYPKAEVHVFSGSGHATALLQPEKLYEVMDRFLE